MTERAQLLLNRKNKHACSVYWSNKQLLKLSSTTLSSVWTIYGTYKAQCPLLRFHVHELQNCLLERKSAHVMLVIVAFACSATILTSKIITDIIETRSEFSGCAESCDKFVSSPSCQTIK